MILLDGTTTPPQQQPAPTRRAPVGAVAMVIGALVGGLAIIGVATRPAASEPPPSSMLAPFPDQVRTSRIGPEGAWGPAGRVELPPWRSWRVAEGYLLTEGDEVAILGPDLRLRPLDLEGWRVVRGAVDGPRGTVIYGSAHTDPPTGLSTVEGMQAAIWLRDGDGWDQRLLPWRGMVRALAVTEEGMVAIGDAALGARPDVVLATSPDGHRWEMRPAPWIPDSAVMSVPNGFVARAVAAVPSPTTYLHSPDGVDWGPLGDHIVTSAGQVAVLDPEDDRVTVGGRSLPSPGWPVAGAWVEGERLWVHTPATAWTTRTGEEWQPIPLTDDVGFDGGYPALLPFGDRLVAAFRTSSGIELVEWHPAGG